MTQEDKELLLRDLSARLPYGVKVLCKYYADYPEEEPLTDVFTLNEIDTRSLTNPYWIGGEQIKGKGFSHSTTDFAICIDDEDTQFIKPYLRPMSSMTEEEKKEIGIAFNYKWSHVNDLDISSEDWGKSYIEPLGFSSIRYIHMSNVLDYLNSHHFDYRGLIEKGLALEAPEGMYEI